MTIKNNNDKIIDLLGWKLISVKGFQVYSFPQSVSINPDESLTVASGQDAKDKNCNYVWTRSYI